MSRPETPPDSPLSLEDVMGSPGYQSLMTPEVGPGDPAFPFDLPRLDPEIAAPERRARSTRRARGHAVALVFGSYT
ncbi:MAG: hypothetical protein ACR2GT_05275 [Gaiellaceae bacterium]